MQVKLEETESLLPVELRDSTSVESARTPPTTPRRRRVQTRSSGRPIYIAASSPSVRKAIYKQAKTSPAPTPPVPPPRIVSQEELNTALRLGTRSTLVYISEVLSNFFYLLKKPLALLMMLWVVLVLSNMIWASIRAAFAPLCFLPGLSGTSLCYNPMLHGQTEQARQ